MFLQFYKGELYLVGFDDYMCLDFSKETIENAMVRGNTNKYCKNEIQI